MSAVDSPGQWHDFLLGLTTASGALTGLVFVAVSINIRTVLTDRFHRRRAESTFLILLVVLAASLVLLFPGQTRVAVGIESLVVGVLLEIRAARTWPIVRDGFRREAQVTWAIAVISNLLIATGAISLLAGAPGGLYLVAIGLTAVMIRAVNDIWTLFTGTTEADPQHGADAP